MRGQLELLLEVLGQEAVDAADGHEVQHRRRRAPHQDVVGELPLDRCEEVWKCGWNDFRFRFGWVDGVVMSFWLCNKQFTSSSNDYYY